MTRRLDGALIIQENGTKCISYLFQVLQKLAWEKEREREKETENEEDNKNAGREGGGDAAACSGMQRKQLKPILRTAHW